MSIMPLLFIALWLFQVVSSSNYGKQALSLEYENTGLPIFGTLNGTVTELDTLSPSIILNRTDAALNCSSGFMNVQLTFKQPFFGIIYSDFNRNSACKLTGNGKTAESFQLPLTGCGTFQSPARVFTNNIVVRFHPGLEIDGDEIITVVCRYPPPIVPLPIIPESLKIPPVEAVGIIQPLREFEILLIICAIIFLALLLLGIGCSYYCLKKRNIKVVRRRPTSTLGSDITKISEPFSMFDGLKIPRAHAIDASESEDVTESIRTDFHSDIASIESEEEYTSAYSDKMCILSEGNILNMLQEPPLPNFDIKIIKHGGVPFTPAHSTASSESGTVLNAQEQYLTTILERTETNTLETLERTRKAKTIGPPPVHARLNIKNYTMSDVSGTDIDSTSEYSRDETDFSEQDIEIETLQMKNFALQEGQYMSSKDDAETGASSLYHISRFQREIAHQNNFDVLFRIVTNKENLEHEETSSIFTEEECTVIKKILEEDVNIRTELKKTYSREDFYMLQDNRQIKRIISPTKWEVLIRILNNYTMEDDKSSKFSDLLFGEDTRRGDFTEPQEIRQSSLTSNAQETLSIADRSGTEITEYHHYSRNDTYEWDDQSMKY